MKFSIGIPAYKDKFLSQCIISILNQTYNDFELIIVNDASPADLDSIVSGFKDKRIKYYKNTKNFGAINLVDNWNKCLSYAKGEYFVLMGDDDMLEPNYLYEFNKLISNNPNLDVFHCRSYIINEESVKIGLTPVWAEFETVYDNIFHRMKSGRQQFISDFVYRTSALKNRGGFYKIPLAWGTDDITSFIAMDKKGIAHTNKPLFCYRRSPVTISSSGNSEQKLLALDLYQEWMDDYVSKTAPVDVIDTIQKANIEDYNRTYFQKRKIQTLSKTYKNKGILRMLFWFNQRKQYNLSGPLIIYSYIEYLKSKFSDNKN
ncbi:glycosyltransferase family 2 protein [Marinilabilia salmonicolor]|uniref:glycosyltransferase family 2 protein n=1 Tax=Marinilabilia salmonicolor TaxID=989 RepID=UPI00029A44E3|nr:glycosyltransferase family A protein [Marinilabilia salmonicolor]